jgi:sugar lactone lactonase YvrE
LDKSGNLYISDVLNNRTRRIDSNGTIATVAGNGTAGYSGDGGLANTATLNDPLDVVADLTGNLFIADAFNYRIRKVTPAGTITTFAGNGATGSSGDGGSATNTQLNLPEGVALDSTGNVFIAESLGNRIRKVAVDGTITTVAGNGAGGYSGDGGPAVNAQLNSPKGVAVDAAGVLYIADRNNWRIRRVALNGTITTVAGTGLSGYSGDGGPAASAQLTKVEAVALDASGNLFISDESRIRKVAPDGTITTVAGNGILGYSGDGGPATSAQVNGCDGMAIDTSGNIYFADYFNNVIRLLVPVTSSAGPTMMLGGSASGIEIETGKTDTTPPAQSIAH